MNTPPKSPIEVARVALEAINYMQIRPENIINTLTLRSAQIIAHRALEAMSQPVDLETLKLEIWQAVQHPHNGYLDGISEKEKGVNQALDYLFSKGHLK